MAGFGFGAFVFNFVASAIVNPNHVEADPNGYFPIEVADNVPLMIRVLTLCWLSISIFGILLIFPYQDDTIKEQRDQEKFIDDQKTDWLVESTIESKIVSE